MINTKVTAKIEELLRRGRQMVTDHNRDALRVLDEAHELAYQHQDMRQVAFILLAKANYFSLVMNDCAKATELVNEAKELACADDTSLNAHINAGYGVINHILGNTALAQKHYQNAIQLLECTDDRSEYDNERLPTLYYNNFILFSYSVELPPDVNDLDKAMILYQKQGNARGVVNCLIAMANHYYHQHKDTDKAIETIKTAYEKAKMSCSASLIGMACNNAVFLLSSVNKFDECLKYLHEGMECFRQIDNPYLLGSIHHQAGIVYNRMGKHDKAITHLNEAKRIYSENNINYELDKLYDIFSEAYYHLGNYKDAYEYERKARLKLAERTHEEKIKILAKERSQFESVLKTRETELLRQKNKEIEQYVIRLENSNNELKQFAHVASHDLKEPLRMIYSYLTLLRKSLGNQLSEQQEEFINFAVDGARRMERLIDDLLRLAKVDANPKIEKVALAKVIEEIKLNLDTRITERNARIEYKHLPVIMADRA
ncbi:MAG: tetratricopeptide repeat protein, partial [Chitinophagales bacterium]|nr:tetratricopeptide repeat protein [Chitinophagales bacterium]